MVDKELAVLIIFESNHNSLIIAINQLFEGNLKAIQICVTALKLRVSDFLRSLIAARVTLMTFNYCRRELIIFNGTHRGLNVHRDSLISLGNHK